jgi:flagellar biosynthesis/type III secretory pathway M-ring protein FliF/YscJ
MEFQLQLILTLLNVVMVGVIGYIGWRGRRFLADRAEAESTREQHEAILTGVDGSNIQNGLVEIVEMHDDQIEQARLERREADREREKLRERIDTLVQSCRDRAALGDGHGTDLGDSQEPGAGSGRWASEGGDD